MIMAGSMISGRSPESRAIQPWQNVSRNFFVIQTVTDLTFFFGMVTVQFPICNVLVVELDINRHQDSTTVLVASFRTQIHWQQPRHHQKKLHPPRKMKIWSQLRRYSVMLRNGLLLNVIESSSSLSTPTQLLSNERPFKRLSSMPVLLLHWQNVFVPKSFLNS